MYLLEKARVASIPGSAFYRGKTGEKLLRFCFAKDDEALEEACRRLRAP
jgi:aminotransferase